MTQIFTDKKRRGDIPVPSKILILIVIVIVIEN